MGDVHYTQTKFLREDFANDGMHKGYADYAAFSALKPGEISNAFPTTDLMGNQLSKIVKLLEVIPAHKATLEEDFDKLEQLALNRKQERHFKEWLDSKIDAMYVWIAPEFRDGEFENRNWVK